MQISKVSTEQAISYVSRKFLHTSKSKGDLKACLQNPIIRNLIERAILDGNFKYAKEFGYQFIKKINDLCNSRLTTDEVYKQLREYFAQITCNESLQSAFRLETEERINNRIITVKELLGDFSPSTLLDIGFGNGQITNKFVKELNLDSSNARGVEIITRPSLSYSFQPMVYDGYSIPLPDNSQSLITLFSVLHHVEEPGLLIKDLYRVLSPSGKVVVRDFDAPSDELISFNLVMDYIYYKVYNPMPEMPIPEQYHSKDEWINIFKRNNLFVNKISYPELDNPYSPFLVEFKK